MPNVKVGDLAIVKSSKPEYNGRIVAILDVAPHNGFTLPDGRWHGVIVGSRLHWIIKALGGPLLAPIDGVMRPVWYGAGADTNLFPLPGDPVEEESEAVATVTRTNEHG